MTTRTTIHEIAHAVDGYVRFQVSGDQLAISINWPFDLESDEWIQFTATLPLKEVESVASLALAEAGEHRATRDTGEELALTARGELVELDVQAAGPAAPRFIHRISKADLLVLRDKLRTYHAEATSNGG